MTGSICTPEHVVSCTPRHDGGHLVQTCSGTTAIALKPIPPGTPVLIANGKAESPDGETP